MKVLIDNKVFVGLECYDKAVLLIGFVPVTKPETVKVIEGQSLYELTDCEVSGTTQDNFFLLRYKYRYFVKETHTYTDDKGFKEYPYSLDLLLDLGGDKYTASAEHLAFSNGLVVSGSPHVKDYFLKGSNNEGVLQWSIGRLRGIFKGCTLEKLKGDGVYLITYKSCEYSTQTMPFEHYQGILESDAYAGDIRDHPCVQILDRGTSKEPDPGRDPVKEPEKEPTKNTKFKVGDKVHLIHHTLDYFMIVEDILPGEGKEPKAPSVYCVWQNFSDRGITYGKEYFSADILVLWDK